MERNRDRYRDGLMGCMSRIRNSGKKDLGRERKIKDSKGGEGWK